MTVVANLRQRIRVHIDLFLDVRYSKNASPESSNAVLPDHPKPGNNLGTSSDRCRWSSGQEGWIQVISAVC